MAIGRVFETTKERVEALFERKEMTSDERFQYIAGMHPKDTENIDMDVITGLIRFIYDNIGLGSADVYLMDDSGKKISCYMNSIKAVFISDECVIECSNFSSQYPVVSVRELDKDIYNNTFMGFNNLNILEKKHTIYRLMTYLSSIIVRLYKNNG